ncbi:MAG: hypothetical protein OXI90_15300 [Gammaproteobacteria bacterium]|nr:hypothetical protein [Gammaproteobacteria bacterium]
MITQQAIASALVVVLVAQTTPVVGQANVELRDELVALRESDQSGRMLIQEAFREHGHDSPEVMALWEKQSQADAKNLARLREIISEHGWPGQSLVGRDGATAAFLILQHADHETQVEYLPLVKAAVEAGEFERRRFALLQDRVLVGEDKPQVYGTQLYWDDETGKLELFPIEDEENVDSRREEIGMMPLAEYVELVRGSN